MENRTLISGLSYKKIRHGGRDPQCQCVVNYPKVIFPFFHCIRFLLSKYCAAEKVISATLSVASVTLSVSVL